MGVMKQILGTTGSWAITGQSRNRPVTGIFSAGDALDAKVYRGDGQSTLFSPDVTWIDPDACTVRFTCRNSVVAGAGITAGEYRAEVGVTPVSDGERRPIFYGVITFVGTSGSSTPPATIASWTDMLLYSSDVAKLQQQDVDQTQFAGQRAEAMGLFIQDVVRRYNPRPGGSRRYTTADGSGPGSYLGFSPSPDGSPPPSRAEVASWLSTPGRLVITKDIVEANARYAAALVYGSSPGQNSPYKQMADQERALARQAVQRAVIEIDAKTVADGSPTVRVDRDVIYLT